MDSMNEQHPEDMKTETHRLKYELLSEFRSIYETSDDDLHTYRVTITMQDRVDGDLLRSAVRLTMKRYPYYCVKLVRENERYFLLPNSRDFSVLHSNDAIVLGTEATHDHLLAFGFWENTIHIDAWHALLDGGAMGNVLNTLLYYYCGSFYGKDLSSRNVLLCDSPVDEREWLDPYRNPIDLKREITIQKWSGAANLPGLDGADWIQQAAWASYGVTYHPEEASPVPLL